MANYSEFTNGIGISESNQSKFDTLVSVDVHSNPGKAQCSKALADIDTGGLVASLPTCSLVASNGDLFLGADTKIYKISSGTITLVHTSTQGAVLGLGEHLGYLYYATATKLGRQTVALASSEASWSSQTDAWATFTNQKTYKHIVWINQILCIADGNFVAIVDENGDFLANALDVLERDIITALCNTNDTLSIGTLVNSAIHSARIYAWDTYSPSWSEDFEVKERGVNMFFEIDGFYYVQIGTVGNIYQWTGSQALFYKRLRDSSTVVVTGVNPYGTASLNGLTLIATIRGIFSIGKSDSSLPLAMVIEYVSSEGQGATLGALESLGSDIYVGVKNGTTYAVDHISANYATGKIITPETDGKARNLKIRYTSMPTNCSITSKIKEDDGSFAAHTLIKDDEDLREFRSDVNIHNKSTCQAEISLVPSGATTPVIKSITIN